MNGQAEKILSGTQVMIWLRCLFALGLSIFVLDGWLVVGQENGSRDLTVHEWGTFTAVAGKHGQAVEWTALRGVSDLPEFVEHLSYASLKQGLRGTIRMETPVLYFYSPREQTVSVKVTFSQGLITEWYPRATRVQPSGIFPTVRLSQLQTDGSITWDGVVVSPNLSGELPREERRIATTPRARPLPHRYASRPVRRSRQP